MNDLDKQLCRLLFVLTIGLLVFAALDAIFPVKAETSFGLQEILHTIELLAGGILGILAGRRSVGTDKPDDKP